MGEAHENLRIRFSYLPVCWANAMYGTVKLSLMATPVGQVAPVSVGSYDHRGELEGDVRKALSRQSVDKATTILPLA